MTNFAKLPTWADKQHVYAVVETPRGSRAKLEFDPKLGAFTLAKPLLAGLTYPYDWGFIPSTRAEDGDPLDVLIIHDAATYPGLVLKCKPIGVLEVVQTSRADCRSLATMLLSFNQRDRTPWLNGRGMFKRIGRDLVCLRGSTPH
jgi:inorganic pyrophosphatase